MRHLENCKGAEENNNQETKYTCDEFDHQTKHKDNLTRNKKTKHSNMFMLELQFGYLTFS